MLRAHAAGPALNQREGYSDLLKTRVADKAKETSMTTIRITAVTVLALGAMTAIDVGPSFAETYRPWCVQYSGRSGARSCAFTSFEQCMMTARGGGGFCVQNPWYLAYGSGQKSPESTGRSNRAKRR